MIIQHQDRKLSIAAEQVAERVREVVAQALELNVEDVTMDSSLLGLGGESLDLLDMAFRLEKEYRIQFPRNNVLERAASHFGEEALVVDGVVTDLGLRMLLRGMPEIDPQKLKPGLKAIDVDRMITVGSFVRITLRLLEAKADLPRECTKCRGTLVESEVMPEFVCSGCGEIVPLPSGDEILLGDLIRLFEASQVDS